VQRAPDGERALALAAQARFDLVLVAAALPDMRSTHLVRALVQGAGAPVCVVADRAVVQDKIRFLQDGAALYLAPPLGRARVMASLAQLLVTGDAEASLAVGDLLLQPGPRLARFAGQPLDLSRTEFDLLAILMRQQGEVIRHEQLLTAVWGAEYRDRKSHLWVSMSRLRRKLGRFPDGAGYIQTRSGIGYALLAPGAGAG
jgi:two-component system, OmpR family, KDP operon response regulator KdpE